MVDGAVFNNPAIFAQYEPGSTFKAITMAVGLDTDIVTPESTYFDEGFVKLGIYTIKKILNGPLYVFLQSTNIPYAQSERCSRSSPIGSSITPREEEE